MRIDELGSQFETAHGDDQCARADRRARCSRSRTIRATIRTASTWCVGGQLPADVRRLRGAAGSRRRPPTSAPSSRCRAHSSSGRARQTPKPFVQGPQTAVVVGPGGEEIYTDKYGRVKVQFHWDRRGKKDENSSCWIRVSQPWAGKSWGAISIPRIGQEVIVDFLEGDPDQPIITGRVYNAEQMPPYELPANKTQSGIVSRSSLGRQPGQLQRDPVRGQEGVGAGLSARGEEPGHRGRERRDRWVGHDRKKTIDHDETDARQARSDRDGRQRRDHHDPRESDGGRRQGRDDHDPREPDRDGRRERDHHDRRQPQRSRSARARPRPSRCSARTRVGINETITVGAAQEVTVGGLQAITVGAMQGDQRRRQPVDQRRRRPFGHGRRQSDDQRRQEPVDDRGQGRGAEGRRSPQDQHRQGRRRSRWRRS